ncbi:MBL fold metallo-hydrolase [Aquimarina hainanensis]|uniref:MBL fold metallo-hydrolase n=1 Tax=Aquimarina hainanensis TaxID=1578017 RepID=A0ABW5ND06_9FLAO
MKRIVKIIKKMLITIGIVMGVMTIVGLLFVTMSPQFGGKATKEQQKEYAKSENYKDGKFSNLGGVKMDMSGKDMLKAIGGMFKSIPESRPASDLMVQKVDSINIAAYAHEKTRFMWFGHSAFLMQTQGQNILIDPMLSEVPAPHPWLGGKRFSDSLPIEIAQIPQIDAVLISHDHYDHLDYESIIQLKDKVRRFFTPLGIGKHLIAWGVPKEKIVELDWGQKASFNELTFISTPAQHFSGRGVSDRDTTLWCSWIIQSPTEKIFFSGDSGYASHFKTIGDTYGPFDIAFMECGQYNTLWPSVHMFPEETAQAGVDVKAKKIMPIHWGAFKLAQHSWTDPVQRVLKKAEEINIDVLIPEIGKLTYIDQEDSTSNQWWKAM